MSLARSKFYSFDSSDEAEHELMMEQLKKDGIKSKKRRGPRSILKNKENPNYEEELKKLQQIKQQQHLHICSQEEKEFEEETKRIQKRRSLGRYVRISQLINKSKQFKM